MTVGFQLLTWWFINDLKVRNKSRKYNAQYGHLNHSAQLRNCAIPLIINTCSNSYRLSPSGIAGRGLWLRCTAERHCSCEPPRGSRTSPAWSRQPRRSRTSSRRPRCLLPAQRPADRSRTPHGRHRGTGGTPAEGKTCPENAHGKISLKVRAAQQQEEASGRNKKKRK